MSATTTISPLSRTTQIQSDKSPVYPTGLLARQASRIGTHDAPTFGLAPTYIQANLLVLPSRYASDFRLLCLRNPVSCPLLAESASTGSYDVLKSYIPGLEGSAIAADVDIRRDAPKYMVYQDGELAKFQTLDITEEWTDDHVAFLIGCSFSFENALEAAGLQPRHVTMNRNVPMYRTNIPLATAGVFQGGTSVVSMRPYRKSEIETARKVTRPYVATHGEPIAWGWKAVTDLGIKDFSSPEWGDPPLTLDGRPEVEEEDGDGDPIVPVFWGCGVTPQNSVMKAGLKGIVMGHAPGHMLVLDIKDGDILEDV